MGTAQGKINPAIRISTSSNALDLLAGALKQFSGGTLK
jgi:hypothetical protein